MLIRNGLAYIRYSEDIKERYRFIHTKTVTEFLQYLTNISVSKIKNLPNQFPMWRAQLGHKTRDRPIDGSDPQIVTEEIIPFPKERMIPRKNIAQEGRVNTKGIPCFYAATDKNTAMSEVRPWVGARISLGKFISIKELRVVDLSIGNDFQRTVDHLFGTLLDEELEKVVWSQINEAFSTPITDSPSTAEYVPTQVIAEVFRRDGYDGLVYKSSLNTGFNIALFDLESVELVERYLYKVDEISIKFSEER